VQQGYAQQEGYAPAQQPDQDGKLDYTSLELQK
jgi:hypothetical protein